MFEQQSKNRGSLTMRTREMLHVLALSAAAGIMSVGCSKLETSSRDKPSREVAGYSHDDTQVKRDDVKEFWNLTVPNAFHDVSVIGHFGESMYVMDAGEKSIEMLRIENGRLELDAELRQRIEIGFVIKLEDALIFPDGRIFVVVSSSDGRRHRTIHCLSLEGNHWIEVGSVIDGIRRGANRAVLLSLTEMDPPYLALRAESEWVAHRLGDGEWIPDEVVTDALANESSIQVIERIDMRSFAAFSSEIVEEQTTLFRTDYSLNDGSMDTARNSCGSLAFEAKILSAEVSVDGKMALVAEHENGIARDLMYATDGTVFKKIDAPFASDFLLVEIGFGESKSAFVCYSHNSNVVLASTSNIDEPEWTIDELYNSPGIIDRVQLTIDSEGRPVVTWLEVYPVD